MHVCNRILGCELRVNLFSLVHEWFDYIRATVYMFS